MLERLREFLQILGVTLVHIDPASHGGSVQAAAGIDPEAVEEYPRWASYDLAGRIGLDTAPGTIVHTGELLSDSRYERSTFYSEFLRRYGLFYVVGSKLLVPSPGGMTAIGIHRPKGRPFEPSDLDRFGALVPHVRRSLEVHRRLVRSERRERELAEALDRLACGAMLLDSVGRIIAANRRARRIAANKDGFDLAAEGLRGATPAITQRVRRAVRSAVDPDARLRSPEPRVVRMPRSSGSEAYRLFVSPLGTKQERVKVGEREAVAIAFVTDPERRIAASEGLIEEVLGLTAAEARIALRLARGATTSEIAAALGIKPDTVRTQLKRIFLKTGAPNQAQLVARLLSILPPLDLE